METQTKKTTVKLIHLFHNEAKQIKLDFFYDPQLVEEIKEINGIRWSKENKCWYIKNNKDNLKLIFDALKGKVNLHTKEFFKPKVKKETEEIQLTLPEIKAEPNFEDIIDEYIEVLITKSYSKSTIKAHKAIITNFIDFYRNSDNKEVVMV